MYKQSNYRGSSSIRGGGPNRYQGSFRKGGFRGGQNFSGNSRFSRKIRTLSTRDPNIFIKKAASDFTQIDQTTIQSFNEFNIPQILKDNIAEKGYLKPTPIQDKSINPMIEGSDLIGLANTGTGKTAAFLIPIISKIFADRSKKAIIVAPTRELASQITDELRSFTRGMGIYSCLLIGGANIRRQVHELRRGVNIVIGTPGRIKDLIEQRVLNLGNFEIVVLDEVDLMVDIGFIDDVKFFISLLPEIRQSLFFSATINPKVSQILQSFVKNPITVSVKQNATAENVEQNIVRIISQDKKIEQLHDLLITDGFSKVLVFGRTKHGVEKLHKDLTFRGFKVGAIHGNKSQGQRQRVLQSFKMDQIQILLATDVASRGLDIPDVSHVINYELPETYEDYIHRIGRTGRAGKTGTALTFI